MNTKRAKVINPECLLYGEEVEIIAEEVKYFDQDMEEYSKNDLEFLD